ncbi:MAG: hypothetical protein DCC75_12980, partial [Proteobacteria bacterium]
KRLPPKGVNRQVSVDVEMGADIVAFAMGHNSFSTLSQYQPQTESSSEHSVIEHHAQHHGPGRTLFPLGSAHRPHYRAPQRSTGSGSAKPVHDEHDSEHGDAGDRPDKDKPASSLPQNRIVTVVCPGRDLSYPISLAKELGADTVNADFGQFNTGDILKSAAKWIDLSDSETIWRD